MPRTKILTRSYAQAENIPPSTGQASPHKKTRVPASVRAREEKLREATVQAPRPPVSARQREAARRREEALAGSSIDDAGVMPLHRTGKLADSSASDEVKEMSILDFDSEDSGGPVSNFSQPKLSARAASSQAPQTAVISPGELAINPVMPSAITMMAGMIWNAIESEDWDRLGNLVDSMHEQQFRLDAPELKSSTAVQHLVHAAPLALLADMDDMTGSDDEKKWLLALDLMDLGCDGNATDQQGNRVVDLLRQKASPALIAHVAGERPDLGKLLSAS